MTSGDSPVTDPRHDNEPVKLAEIEVLLDDFYIAARYGTRDEVEKVREAILAIPGILQ